MDDDPKRPRLGDESQFQSYWDWLPAELQQWILRLVRLDAANLLTELVANERTLKLLKQRFNLKRESFRPSWQCVGFMQRVFSRGPLLQQFELRHKTPPLYGQRFFLNNFFTIDGFEGHSLDPPGDIHQGFRNVDALVECGIHRMDCAHSAFDLVNTRIDDQFQEEHGDYSYCCDTFPKLRFLVQTTFSRPPRNRKILLTQRKHNPKFW